VLIALIDRPVILNAKSKVRAQYFIIEKYKEELRQGHRRQGKRVVNST